MLFKGLRWLMNLGVTDGLTYFWTLKSLAELDLLN